MDRFLPLTQLPTLLWQNTPPLAPGLSAKYRRRLREIEEHPHFFNGRITLARELENGCLRVAPADYALAAVVDDLQGWSVLAVRALIINDQGQMLWPRRGPKTVMADYWEPGAGGAIDQASPERAVKTELSEELSIDAFPEGALRFEGLGQSPNSMRLIWSLRANQFRANPDEVSDAIWLAPPEIPHPILPHYGPELLKRLQAIVAERS